MKQQLLGRSDLRVGRLSYGCMRIAGAWNPAEVTPAHVEAGKRAVRAAVEAGYTLFDHADIYSQGEGERIFGEVLRESPGLRDQIVIATKCGIRWAGDAGPRSPHRYDFSAAHIAWSCERSLERLGVETIDLYQLHRPDVLMDSVEIAEAFDRLHRSGKVRWFGVSNFTPSQVAALQAHLPMPLVVNQVEIHPGRLACFEDGTLDQCLERTMTPLAWSPVGGGLFGDGGVPRTDDPRHGLLHHLLAVIDEVATEYGVSRTAMTMAWLMRHPTNIVPIVGSVQPDRIRDAAAADAIELTREDWYRILLAARGRALP